MATLLSVFCQSDGGSVLYRQQPVITCVLMQRRCRNSHTRPDIAPSLKLQVMDDCQTEGFKVSVKNKVLKKCGSDRMDTDYL